MKLYLIEEKKLETLLKESQLLSALKAGGVYDWEWFEESIEQYEQQNECDIDYIDDIIYKFPIYKDDMNKAEELYNELDNISKT